MIEVCFGQAHACPPLQYIGGIGFVVVAPWTLHNNRLLDSQIRFIAAFCSHKIEISCYTEDIF